MMGFYTTLLTENKAVGGGTRSEKVIDEKNSEKTTKNDYHGKSEKSGLIKLNSNDINAKRDLKRKKLE